MRAIDPHSRGGASDSEYPPLAADGDSVPAELQSGDLQGLPPDARAAAQSLAQDLDGIPPDLLRPAGPGAWRPEERDEGDGAAPPPAASPTPSMTSGTTGAAPGGATGATCTNPKAPAGDHEWVDEVRSRHAHLIRSIRRRFEALRGEDKPQRRQFDGEEIDLDAQVEARADRKSGSEPSPRLFIHRRRVERSLAVMFMVDMSGSTKGWVNDAERESLVLLCEAIEALGDSYAIYGFSGWTRTHCDIYPVKRFADRYDAATRQRIAGIEARDYTRMGVAVRHLSGLLVRQNGPPQAAGHAVRRPPRRLRRRIPRPLRHRGHPPRAARSAREGHPQLLRHHRPPRRRLPAATLRPGALLGDRRREEAAAEDRRDLPQADRLSRQPRQEEP
jgi:hypothetical protein